MQDLRTVEDPRMLVPYLEHYPEREDIPQRIRITDWPFRLGRNTGLSYTVYSSQVSKEHAEIICVDDEYRIRDLGSTNGTFVNGQRIEQVVLNAGDIIHIARKEFRFGLESAGPADLSKLSPTVPAITKLPTSLIQASEHLRDLIEGRKVRVLFQPIVHLDTKKVLGYEALGRSLHEKLGPKPARLFELADQCRLAPELSRLFRDVAIEEAQRLPPNARLFLNLHPSEMLDDALVNSARDQQDKLRPGQKLVLEVHEDAVADLKTILALRERSKKLGIEIAYDDFGAGQSRLAEMTEAPPDFIKLHITLVRGIPASHARQELILALNRVIKDLGVELIAEGIETTEEAGVCRTLGCRFGQGFLFGRPQTLVQGK